MDVPPPPRAHVCVELESQGRRWRLRCARWASWASFIGLAVEATGIQNLGKCRILLNEGGHTRDGGEEGNDHQWRKFAMGGGGGALVLPPLTGLSEGYLHVGEARPVHWKLGKMLGKGAYG